MDGLVSSGKWRDVRAVAEWRGRGCRIEKNRNMGKGATCDPLPNGEGAGAVLRKIEIREKAQRAIRCRRVAGATREHLSVQNIEGAT